MGDVVDLEAYRRRRSVTKEQFVKTVAGLDLPAKSGDDEWGERELDEEEMNSLPEDIRALFRFPGNKLRIYRDRAIGFDTIRISDRYAEIAIEVSAEANQGLFTSSQNHTLITTPPNYDADTPAGRENTGRLATILLTLAKHPKFTG